MAEYIKLEALTAENLEQYMTVFEVKTKEYGRQTVVAVDDLQYLPTADVEEVRHGKWVDDIFGRGDMVCSECEQYPATDEDGNPLPSLAYWQPYRCPNCGAKMDGKEGAGQE